MSRDAGKHAFALGDYLADNAAALALELAAVGVAWLMMCVFGLQVSQALAVCLVFIASIVVTAGIKFATKRRFYDRLEQTTVALAAQGRAWLAPELMDAPQSCEERLVHETLRIESKSMGDQIAALRAEQREYRDYVETWVHEVKTPIAAARLVAANAMTPATEAMDVELRRIEGFVDQSLFYARSSSVDRDFMIRSVNLGEYVRAALRNAARTLIDAGVSPRLGDLDVAVRADPKWLEFIIRQVLINAAKYRRSESALAGEPATVYIDAEKTQTGLDAWCVTLRIQDNGIGVPAADLPRVFDRCSSSPRPRTTRGATACWRSWAQTRPTCAVPFSPRSASTSCSPWLWPCAMRPAPSMWSTTPWPRFWVTPPPAYLW